MTLVMQQISACSAEKERDYTFEGGQRMNIFHRARIHI